MFVKNTAPVFGEVTVLKKVLQYSCIKAIPLQAWTGPGVSRRLRLPDFKAIGT
jgi:hypothetical protein